MSAAHDNTVPVPRFDPVARRRALPLLRAMQERVLVCDGAMGTMIQARTLTAEDYGVYDGCPEILVRTRPDVIRDIHAAYFDAGADCVETNTFGGMPHVLAEFDLAADCYELNRRAAEIAKDAAREYSTPDKPRFVLGAWCRSGT
jgi:5-methyltetrahydrofolate--homocysteine methyltransferase